MLRKAFTLMEVNLAILIMAGGVLSVVSLFALGYRENRQSREDVAAAAYADAVLSPLIMACSATNLKWSVYRQEWSLPGTAGWGDYLDRSTGLVKGNPQSDAVRTFNQVMAKMKGAAQGGLEVPASWPSTAEGGLRAGLIATHEKDSAVVKLSFRASRNPSELLAMPMFYTEVRFQGLADE